MRESLQEVLSSSGCGGDSPSGKLKNNNNNNNINNNNNNNNNINNNGSVFSGLLGSAHHLFQGSVSPLMNPLALMNVNPSSPNLFHNQLFAYTPPLSSKKQRVSSKSHQPIVSSTNQINENNNNNHRPERKLQELEVKEEIPSAPLSPPTSGSSPQSNGSNGSAEVGSSIGRPSSSCGGDSRDKSFTCGICNRSFGYKHVLQNHERTHTGEKPFGCPECQKRFTRDHHLKTHMRLHTGEKPYKCKHCDRDFVQVANLRRHLRVHTGERPYACELCSSRFSDSNQLKAHMLIHKGEKPFECELCRGKFRRRHHLNHHKCPRGGNVVGGGASESYGHFLMSTKTELMDDEMIPMTDLDKDADIEDDEDHNVGGGVYNNNSVKRSRERKSRDIRRVIRFPPSPSPPSHPLVHHPHSPPPAAIQRMMLPLPLPAALVLPEQTEPEDLSIKGRRRGGGSGHGLRGHVIANGHVITNTNSNSSLGDSPRSATPPSDEELGQESLRLEYLHPKFRRHFLATSQPS